MFTLVLIFDSDSAAHLHLPGRLLAEQPLLCLQSAAAGGAELPQEEGLRPAAVEAVRGGQGAVPLEGRLQGL